MGITQQQASLIAMQEVKRRGSSTRGRTVTGAVQQDGVSSLRRPHRGGEDNGAGSGEGTVEGGGVESQGEGLGQGDSHRFESLTPLDANASDVDSDADRLAAAGRSRGLQQGLEPPPDPLEQSAVGDGELSCLPS